MRILPFVLSRFLRPTFATTLLPGLILAQDLRVERLRCEYRVDPVGIDVRDPRLSWVLKSPRRGERQTAYHVQAASSRDQLRQGTPDLWDTGRIDAEQTVHLAYAGRPLHSRQAIWWRVRVWDREGRASAWSDPATWTMGLLEPAEWQAKWIADPSLAVAPSARGPLNGYHSQLTTNATAVKWVQVDLGRARRLGAVRLFPARPYDWQPDTPGFLFPRRFKIEAASSADFVDAQLLVDRTVADEPNPGADAPLFRFAPTTNRFVRLTATRLALRDGDQHAFALAELQVLDGVDNLANGARVEALDSIETGPWAATNLTDGITHTVAPGSARESLPGTLARKTFTVPATVRRATARATALGVYELRLNGQRVGDQILAPEWTSYRRRVAVQTFDVTDLLHPGDNVVTAQVGEGWYAGRLMAVGRFPYGHQPRFLLQLEIELADGSRQFVVTDESWRTTTNGPVRAAGIYDGETYDARLEPVGWERPAFDDHEWNRAQTFPPDTPELVWQANEPIRVVRELAPIRVTEPRPGVHVFDLGQNMVGWCRIKAAGRAGQPVMIRHAEMLADDGTLYTANLRGAAQTDRYIPRTDGPFVYEPRFTYHGFRYVEVSGLAETPNADAVRGRVFHSNAPEAGRFACSDPALNQLMEDIVWTQRANLVSSPNDCPQRDERFGWMGDIQAFAQTAMFTMDLGAFFTKFVQDIRDDQADDGRFPDFAPHPGDPNQAFSGAPAWADAGVIVPWRAYENYADTRLLAAHFDAASRWIDYIHRNNPDLVWVKGRNNDYNDWLNGDWIKQSGWPEKGGSVPKEVFATAFFAHSTDLVSRMARVLERDAEAARYGELFGRIKETFNRRFVRADGRIEGDTQGGYALALHFDSLPEALRAPATAHLLENIRRYQGHLSTGIQTTHRAMLELARHGQADTAWQLLTDRSFPSWLYMIDNGATTIWERWDGYVKGRGFQDAGMNSFNHWAFGAVGEWMWRHIIGLNPDEQAPGWKHFHIAPKPGGGVTWARGEYTSIRGLIRSAWRVHEGMLTLHVEVPPNTTATVHLPTPQPSRVTEGGRPVTVSATQPDAVVIEVEAGNYEFTCPFAGDSDRVGPASVGGAPSTDGEDDGVSSASVGGAPSTDSED
ncbi:MAG: family 78 glycoside hydrolase catalytic domain [Verrucomicrobiales bacterium]|nr:family 78 glycoside hydrolase catalytic domain [Verrucomicrobiales bacterium]MCP5525932.1 family 78 glycoside hydrolase catalytic domain [Verrucomicrobiales bacterium]